MRKHRLLWVDEFLNRIKPYVFMRTTDNVLIRMPNEAFRLNDTGARVVAHILEGGSILDFIRARNDSPETEEQLERFFTTLYGYGIMKCVEIIQLRLYKGQSSA